METVLNIVIEIGGLIGVAACIAMLINVLKIFGLVKDGNAGAWSAVMNTVALAVLVSLKLYRPDLDLKEVDVQISAFAQVLGIVLSLLAQIKFSGFTHDTLSGAGVPVVGKSYENEIFETERAEWKAQQTLSA